MCGVIYWWVGYWLDWWLMECYWRIVSSSVVRMIWVRWLDASSHSSFHVQWRRMRRLHVLSEAMETWDSRPLPQLAGLTCSHFTVSKDQDHCSSMGPVAQLAQEMHWRVDCPWVSASGGIYFINHKDRGGCDYTWGMWSVEPRSTNTFWELSWHSGLPGVPPNHIRELWTREEFHELGFMSSERYDDMLKIFPLVSHAWISHLFHLCWWPFLQTYRHSELACPWMTASVLSHGHVPQ